MAAEAGAVASALDELRLDEAVIKPAIGASGVGVERVRRGDEAAGVDRLRAGARADQVLVQEFMADITGGDAARAS